MDISSEYIQYAQDVEQALSHLESQLHNSDDPEEIIRNMLVAATLFYDGDWAGIMEADLTMKIWSPLLWYNHNTGSMTPNRFKEIEEGDYLWRWIDALTHGKPMIITDIEEIRKLSPIEYYFLKHNSVRTMIAVPFWKRPTGFLIVRNPKRYISRTSLLQMMAFVAVSSVNEKRLMDSIKMSPSPAVIKRDTDIVVNLFDELQIITSRGVITESDLHSPKISRLVAYLILHDKHPAPPREIANAIWPEDEEDIEGKNIKYLVYRLQQTFSLISDYRLIESTLRGYRINPDLRIITDLQMFEECWNQAQISADISAKGNLLKKAIEIYKQGILPSFDCDHWLMHTVAHYNLRYIGAVNELLAALDSVHDYVCIHEYANIAIKAVPGSVDAHYWLIYAMSRLGTPQIAKRQLQAARQTLTADDYQDLIQRLHTKAIV